MCHLILYYLGAIVSIFGMVASVPAGRVRLLTRAGRNSIYIYFGQMYFLMVYEGIGVVFLTKGVAIPPALAGLVWLATTFIAWSLLSQPCFKCCYGPCVEPRVELCCIAAELEPSAAGGGDVVRVTDRDGRRL